MKRLWLLAIFLALTPARAQQVPVTGNLTAQDSGACTTANACLSMNVPKDAASALIQLSGTWTATIQFEASSGQGPSGSPFSAISATPINGSGTVTSVTSNGAWRVNVASINVLRLRVSSYGSGTVAAALTSSQASTFSSTSFVPTGGSIGGGGIACFIPIFTSGTNIGDSNATDCNGIFTSTDPVSQPSSLYPCTNSASGTTNGLLVTTDSNGNCINIPNGQTTNIVGIAYSGGGTTGTVQVCQIGTCPVILDNQSVIGDCIVPAATGAQGHDSGTANCPSGVEQIGRATSLNSGSATAANARVFISDVISQSQGQAQVIQVNGTTIAGTNANFNGTTPAAQTNNQNLVWQTNNSAPTSAISVEVPISTTSQLGIVELAQDLCGTGLLPVVCGIQQKAVTFANISARDVICFVTTSNLANCPLGVPIRTVSGNSDTILAADRVTDVRYTAASGATAVTLPQAGSTGFANNITMILTNAQGSGTVTVTPTTSTINGASTLAIASGVYCFIYSDNTNYFANCGMTNGGGSVSGTGTNNTITKWTGTTSIGNSSATDDGTNPTRTPNGLNTAANGNFDEWTVDTGGVTANKLACRSSNNKAQICATSTTTGVLGVALTTQTSGQTVAVCWASHCSVVPTNNTTAGHWLIPSTTVAGDVDDTGSTTEPTGTQTFLAESTVTAPAVVATTILSPDTTAAAAGGKPLTLEVNGTATAIVANLVNGTGITFTPTTTGNTTTITPTVTGGGGGGTFFALENCNPDTSGLVFWTVNALTNWRDGHWEWSDTIASDTILYCKIRIPHSLPSGTAHIILSGLSANDNTSGHTMTFKSGDSLISTTVNASACTYQSTQNFTTTTTAYAPSTLTFGVNATLAGDSLLIVCIDATTESSLAANVMLEGLYLSFY